MRRDHRRTHERTAKAVFARHGGWKQSRQNRTYGCAIRRIVRARARVGEDRYVRPITYVSASYMFSFTYICYIIRVYKRRR